MSDQVVTPGQEQQQSEEQQMAAFLAKDDNRQNALSLATQINQVVGGKWFTVHDLVRKSSESRMTAYQKIKLCEMFGLIITRVGDIHDRPKHMREPLFKVTITLQDRIEGMRRIVKYHLDQVNSFELQIKALNDQLQKQQNFQSAPADN